MDCSLSNTCPGKPLSQFLATLILLAASAAIVMGPILYYVYKRISLESQLVDYWWKIQYADVEIVSTRRKNAGDGSSVVTGGSQVSSQCTPRNKIQKSQSIGSGQVDAVQGARSSVTKLTLNTSLAFNSSAADVCYGNMSLGVYKLAKVALKPIKKFHQSRKLMIELRTVSRTFETAQLVPI